MKENARFFPLAPFVWKELSELCLFFLTFQLFLYNGHEPFSSETERHKQRANNFMSNCVCTLRTRSSSSVSFSTRGFSSRLVAVWPCALSRRALVAAGACFAGLSRFRFIPRPGSCSLSEDSSMISIPCWDLATVETGIDAAVVAGCRERVRGRFRADLLCWWWWFVTCAGLVACREDDAVVDDI